MTSATFWDRAAAKYARQPIANMASYEYTLGRTRGYLAATDRVLEIGCGTGSTALALADAAGHYTATDISPEMIAIARAKPEAARTDNLRFLTCEADDPRLTDDPFDAVLAFNVLHLVPDLEATLAHVAAATRPGGLFISKTFCMPSRKLPFKLRAIKLLLPLMQAIGKAPEVAFFSVAELERAVIAAGFEIIESGNYTNDELRRYLAARRKG
jgi:ubiquinone/menaquinone biosynthesis C-methylase UbiE